MVAALGLPAVRRADIVTGYTGPRSLVGYAAEQHGTPGVIVELGGAGFGVHLELVWRDRLLAGVQGVMQALGMTMDKPPELVDSTSYRRTIRVNPRNGGLLLPHIGGEALGTMVGAGELLGTLVSPHTFEVLEELGVRPMGC